MCVCLGVGSRDLLGGWAVMRTVMGTVIGLLARGIGGHGVGQAYISCEA